MPRPLTRILTAAVAGIALTATLAGCGATQTPSEKLAATVKQDRAQVQTLSNLVPVAHRVAVAPLTKQKDGTDGQYVGCSATEIQYVHGLITYTKDLNGPQFVNGLKGKLAKQGYDTKWYNDTANKVKKLIADKDGYEYWISPVTFTKQSGKALSKTAVTVLGFSACVTTPKTTTSTPSSK